MIDRMELLQRVAGEHRYPLVFATVSGAHLYGFASADSDYDLRGVHVLPLRKVIGLSTSDETVEFSGIREEVELDLVTHDLAKFIKLMLRRNGYVLEQLYSPLVVRTGTVHERMKELGRRCITRHHAHHYLGFADTQWKLFEKETPRRVKPLLYVYRVLLTGIHLMRTGEIEANLPRLNEVFRLGHINELITRKTSGIEKQTLDDQDMALHVREMERLRAELESARDASRLPEAPDARMELEALLVDVRMGSC